MRRRIFALIVIAAEALLLMALDAAEFGAAQPDAVTVAERSR